MQAYILVFVKYFDRGTSTLRYVGCFEALQTTLVKELYPVLCSMAGLAEDTPISLFEVIATKRESGRERRDDDKSEFRLG